MVIAGLFLRADSSQSAGGFSCKHKYKSFIKPTTKESKNKFSSQKLRLTMRPEMKYFGIGLSACLT